MGKQSKVKNKMREAEEELSDVRPWSQSGSQLEKEKGEK